MKKIRLKNSFSDSRGKITDILEKKLINSVTMISFNKNSVRANHYHKKTYQWNYLLSGEISYYYKKKKSKKRIVTMKPGDLVLSPPNEEHALKAKKKSLLLVLTKGPRGGKEYESDTFRLKKVLI